MGKGGGEGGGCTRSATTKSKSNVFNLYPIRIQYRLCNLQIHLKVVGLGSKTSKVSVKHLVSLAV